MRTLEEINEQRAQLAPIANSPERSTKRELARNLMHILTWVTGTSDYLPPLEMLGWVETNISELTAAINRDPSGGSIEDRTLSAIVKLQDKG
jgi:hypothetical protein